MKIPLKSVTTTYRLTTSQLRDMFAEELGVDPTQVIVAGDMRTEGDMRESYQVFTGSTITVNAKPMKIEYQERD